VYYELCYVQFLQEEVSPLSFSLAWECVQSLISYSLFDACKKGGWQLGHLVDGTQAEYIRMPFADSCLYPVPEGADERSLLVYSDILPTGLEVGVLRGTVKPGSTIAIVGAGPVGLAAGICARLYSPNKIVYFDRDQFRLDTAKKIGATEVYKVDDAKEAREVSKQHFGDKDGFDVVIEAVGVPETFLMCQELVGIGGNIANVGVHGTKVDLHIEKLWSRSTSEPSCHDAEDCMLIISLSYLHGTCELTYDSATLGFDDCREIGCRCFDYSR
jgi:alcohol dehydrogenase